MKPSKTQTMKHVKLRFWDDVHFKSPPEFFFYIQKTLYTWKTKILCKHAMTWRECRVALVAFRSLVCTSSLYLFWDNKSPCNMKPSKTQTMKHVKLRFWNVVHFKSPTEFFFYIQKTFYTWKTKSSMQTCSDLKESRVALEAYWLLV